LVGRNDVPDGQNYLLGHVILSVAEDLSQQGVLEEVLRYAQDDMA
jgi:hypothetical protein